MQCHACGTEVSPEQKFCQECGQSLRGVTDATVRFDAPPAAGDATPPAGLPEDDAVLPRLEDLPTREITPREPLPDPRWSDIDGAAAANPIAADDPSEVPGDAASEIDTADFTGTNLTDRPTDEPAHEIDTADFTGTTVTGEGSGDPTSEIDTSEFAATTVFDAPADHDVGSAHDTAEIAATSVITVDGRSTDEFPALFDGSGDVVEYPPGREPFQIRLIFVLAFFGAVAAIMTSAADVTDIRTTTPIDGIDTGIRTLSDIGVNLPVGGYIGAGVMLFGGLLACYGLRWGAGVAGGAGLALAGWAGLTIGLAEVPIAVAESITRTSSEEFTLRVTRDLGFWLIVAVGVIGVLVFAASLRFVGTGGRRSLNPWVAAVGAVGAVVLAAGPLLPEGSATFSDNFRSPDALIDLPTAYFGGRIGQVALIAFAGVIGFLLVRAWGLGLVTGGISVAVWLWVSSLLGIGEEPATRVQPLGIAAGNFGAGDTEPHGVTTVGMGVTLALLLIASLLAIVRSRRDARF